MSSHCNRRVPSHLCCLETLETLCCNRRVPTVIEEFPVAGDTCVVLLETLVL